jgi:hypothetical protein
MAAPTLSYNEKLIATSCYCGIPVGLPESLYDWMQRDSKNSCYCPNGHSFHFGNTTAEKLREAERRLEQERLRTKATRDLLAAEERSHVATRGHLTRVKKRVQKGVCPHCNRHFENLERHMHSKHPEGDE